MYLLILLSWIICIVTLLAIWSTWFTVKEIAARQADLEKALAEMRELLRKQMPADAKTCIRCLSPVPRTATACPSCGQRFDLA